MAPKMLFIGVFSSFPLVFSAIIKHATEKTVSADTDRRIKPVPNRDKSSRPAPSSRTKSRAEFRFFGFPSWKGDWKGSSPASAKDEKQRQGA